MDKESRFFYHSFPRPRNGEDSAREDERSLAILSSILDRGLLLTFEKLELRERLQSGDFSEPAWLQQKRICFTELAPSELVGHAETFGPIALEWEIAKLREMGAIPVFYVPIGGQQGHVGLADSMLLRLFEAQTVLERLELLEEVCRSAQDKNKFLEITRNGKVVDTTSCTISGAIDILGILNSPTGSGVPMQPFGALVASIRGLSGFFYPVENLTYTDQLGYYRQREWRIVSNVVAMGTRVTECLSDDEINELIQLDEAFFGREVDAQSGRKTQASLCQYYRQFQDYPLHRTIRRIVVPCRLAETVDKILKDRQIELPIVFLEDLPDNNVGS